MRCPLYVFGFPRSGTTLLTALLNGNPHVHLANASGVLRHCAEAGIGLGTRLDRSSASGVIDALESNRVSRRYLGSLSPGVRQNAMTAIPCDLKTFYELLVRQPDADVWGEKTHWNQFLAESVLAHYPRAGFVHIVRDGRSVALSKVRKGIARRRGIRADLVTWESATRDWIVPSVEVIRRWSAFLEHVRDVRRSIPDDGYVEIRYEDLVADAEGVLNHLSDRLGIGIDPLVPARQPGNIPAYAHANVEKPMDSTRISPFESLPAAHRWALEKAAAEPLRRYGYELSHPKISSVDRLRLALHRGVRRARQGRTGWEGSERLRKLRQFSRDSAGLH